MGSPLMEVKQKPAVLVAVLGSIPSEMILSLEYGLEEEGIPSERVNEAPGDAADGIVAVASRTAKASRINVGLGVSQNHVVLHHRDLPEDKPLFSLTGRVLSDESLYRLGRNAARLVKGNPFIYGDETSEN